MKKTRDRYFLLTLLGMVFFALLMLFYNLKILNNPSAPTSEYVFVGILWGLSYIYLFFTHYMLFQKYGPNKWFSLLTFITPLIPFIMFFISSKDLDSHA